MPTHFALLTHGIFGCAHCQSINSGANPRSPSPPNSRDPPYFQEGVLGFYSEPSSRPAAPSPTHFLPGSGAEEGAGCEATCQVDKNPATSENGALIFGDTEGVDERGRKTLIYPGVLVQQTARPALEGERVAFSRPAGSALGRARRMGTEPQSDRGALMRHTAGG